MRLPCGVLLAPAQRISTTPKPPAPEKAARLRTSYSYFHGIQCHPQNHFLRKKVTGFPGNKGILAPWRRGGTCWLVLVDAEKIVFWNIEAGWRLGRKAGAPPRAALSGHVRGSDFFLEAMRSDPKAHAGKPCADLSFRKTTLAA